MQRSKVEVRTSYYRDKEEHMRKEENCNSSGWNQMVLGGSGWFWVVLVVLVIPKL